MSLITLVIEEVKFVFDINGIVQTIAIVLTALFTLLAAWAAVRSAKTSERQLKESLNRADQINFFGLLDALEREKAVKITPTYTPVIKALGLRGNIVRRYSTSC